MSGSKQVLIVDGVASLRAELAHDVARFGYAIAQAGTAEAAALAIDRGGRIDLVLVAAELPDGDGRGLIARLRRRGVLLPIILIADRASEDDVVAALDAGADDVMVRPLRVRELAARIRAQFRVSLSRADSDLRIGILTYRPATRTAFQPFLPKPVRLTEKEAALLNRLCLAEGRAISRDTLLREVWGYSPDVSSHTVETHIYRLRRKLEAGGDTPQIVLNDGNGYRLATLEPLEQPAPHAAALAKWNSAPAMPTVQPPPRVLAAAIR